jgi:hypothetical protein
MLRYRTIVVAVVVVIMLGFAARFGIMQWQKVQVNRARERGRVDARRDINLGKLSIPQYGRSNPYDPEFADVLSRQYGVEPRFHAPEIYTDEAEGAYSYGYNREMEAAVAKKLPEGAFTKALLEAKKRWAHKLAKNDRALIPQGLFPTAPTSSKAPSDCLKPLSSGETLEKILRFCGCPEEEVGTGDDFVFVYHFDDGQNATVTSPDLEKITEIRWENK